MKTSATLFRVLIILALLLPFSTSPVSAGTITVTNLNDSGAGSLRQAILDANDNDTILFLPALTGGTINLLSQLEVNKVLTITAEALSAHIILNGKNLVRPLYVGLKGKLILSDVDIEDGYATELDAISNSGGGIYNRGWLSLRDCVVRHSAAFSTGGGLYNDYGTVEVSNSSFTNNSAESYGGGIANYGELSLSVATVTGNSGSVGGGIFNYGKLTIERSDISENDASIGGGGIRNSSEGSLTMERTDVTHNTAVQAGGGISNSGALDITTSLITYNDVTSDSGKGGGITNSDATVGNSHIITESTISHNTAGNGGGGISNEEGMLILEQCTLVDNTVTHGSGGGIYNASAMNLILIRSSLDNNQASLYGGGIRNFGVLGIANSTLVYNGAQGGGAVSNWGKAVLVHVTISGNTATIMSGSAGGFDNIQTHAEAIFINTIIANSTGGDCNNNSGGVISSDSVDYLIEDGSCGAPYTGDPLLSGPRYYGGLTQTLALMTGSPAIDLGIAPEAPYTIAPLDQRGVPRPQGAGWDLGAYEYDLYELGYFPLIVR